MIKTFLEHGEYVEGLHDNTVLTLLSSFPGSDYCLPLVLYYTSFQLYSAELAYIFCLSDLDF